MTNIYIFRLLAILTMGVVFLPVVFNNLPDPLFRPFFYFVLWILFILVFQFKVLLQKTILPIYLFLLIYFVSIPLFWSDIVIGIDSRINIYWLSTEIGWTFLSVLITTYFIKVKDYYGFGLVTLVALIFMAITSFTSIIGFITFPAATREMAGGLAAATDMEIVYRSMGIGTFAFFTGMAFIFPGLAYYLKRKDLNTKLKMIVFAFVILSFYSIFKSALTTSMLTALMFFIFGLNVRGNRFLTQVITIFLIIILVFVIFRSQVASLLYYLADLLENVAYGTKFKFDDLAKAIEIGDFNPESTKTHISGERLSRSYLSFTSFLENPLVGGGKNAGHAHWLDRLGLFGIVGFIPWVVIFRTQIKQNIRLFSDKYKLFYYLSFIAFIVFGLFKGGLESVETSICIYFIAPGLYFIGNLKFIKRFKVK